MRKDITGQKFGRLTAIGWYSNGKNGDHWWSFICECGKKHICGRKNVVSGSTKSCGCLRIEKNKDPCVKHKTHGMGGTKFYNIWISMKHRCYDVKSNSYEHYGGRGISVCGSWLRFENFKDDMFLSYKKHAQEHGEKDTQIDRINSAGNYEKENCRWTTHKQQCRNRCTNKIIEIGGEKKPLVEWLEIYNLKEYTYRSRINRGIDCVGAITSPLVTKYKNAKVI